MENNDRYLLQKYNEREYGIFDTEKDKFIQKGSLKVMQGALKDLNNPNKKSAEDMLKDLAKEPIDNESKEDEEIKEESYNGFGNKLTESKTDVAAEAIQKYIKEDGSFDTEWFNESVQLQISNVEYLYNKMYNSQSPAHSVAYSGMLQLFSTDGYELTSRQVQAGFKKLGLDFKEILKPTTDWVNEKRAEEKEESKEVKTEDIVTNPRIKDLANEVFDWYDSDMGNHFDEIKDNESEVYNHILSSLENRDQEIIDVYIKDMSEDESMKVVVNQLKQLKDNKLDEELFSASDEVKEDSKEKGLYTESEEPYEASKYKGKEWGIFAKKSRAWVAFGTEKEMKERAERLNKLPKEESKECKTESVESDNIKRIKDCMKQSGIKNPNTLERMSKDVLAILHTYDEDTRDENGLYYFPAILNAIQDKIEQITGKRPELTIESKTVKTESVESVDDITYLFEQFDWEFDITTKEQLGSDYYYHTLVKNVSEAEKFNYHSDYWGSADSYQKDVVDVVKSFEPYINKEVTITYDEGEVEKFKVIGILIDKQYNSISHLKVLVEPLGEVKQESKEVKTENNIPEDVLNRAKDLFDEINKLDAEHSKVTDIEQGKKYVDRIQELTNRLDQLETQYHFGFLDNGEIKLNEAEEIDGKEKTTLDYLQDRIGQKIEVSELNTVLQSLFARYDRLFITYDDVINALDWDEPQELYITDDDDTYTVIYNIVDIEEGIVEITDVIME